MDLGFQCAAFTVLGMSLPSAAPPNVNMVLEKTGNIAQRDLYWHYSQVTPHFLGGNSAGAVLQGDYKLIHSWACARIIFRPPLKMYLQKG